MTEQSRPKDIKASSLRNRFPFSRIRHIETTRSGVLYEDNLSNTHLVQVLGDRPSPLLTSKSQTHIPSVLCRGDAITEIIIDSLSSLATSFLLGCVQSTKKSHHLHDHTARLGSQTTHPDTIPRLNLACSITRFQKHRNIPHFGSSSVNIYRQRCAYDTSSPSRDAATSTKPREKFSAPTLYSQTSVESPVNTTGLFLAGR